MYQVINGKKWRVDRAPSIFTPRKGKEDVTISVEGQWGGVSDDGKRYRSCVRIAAESGETICSYERVPDEFSTTWLRENGFVEVAK
jgi:hypothetical protein